MPRVGAQIADEVDRKRTPLETQAVCAPDGIGLLRMVLGGRLEVGGSTPDGRIEIVIRGPQRVRPHRRTCRAHRMARGHRPAGSARPPRLDRRRACCAVRLSRAPRARRPRKRKRHATLPRHRRPRRRVRRVGRPRPSGLMGSPKTAGRLGVRGSLVVHRWCRPSVRAVVIAGPRATVAATRRGRCPCRDRRSR